MVKNVNDKIKKLRPSQRKKVQARAKELIAKTFLSLLLKEIRAAQRRIERSIDATIVFCNASNARIEALDRRMRKHEHNR
jgi:hypothetical protein